MEEIKLSFSQARLKFVEERASWDEEIFMTSHNVLEEHIKLDEMIS